MAKIISLINQKGGVGKTTTTLSLANYFADKGLRILLIDIDAQANLSDACGFTEENKDPSMKDFLLGSPLKIFNVRENLDILPSTIELSGIEFRLMQEMSREHILENKIKSIKNNYDYIFIDCPPSLSLLTLNALTASDYAIVPFKPSRFSYKGLNGIFDVIKELRERDINDKIIVLGIVLTLYDPKRVVARSLVEKFDKDNLSGGVFKTTIRQAEAIVKAEEEGKSIFVFNKKSGVADDYAALGEEVLERIKMRENGRK